MLQTKPRFDPQKWRADHYSGFFIAARVEGVPNRMEETYGFVTFPEVILSLRNKQ